MAAYAKAIVGALVTGLSTLLVGWEDGNLNGTEITGAIIAFLVALGAVWAVPNRPSAGT
jgi:hypothetical protein